MNLSELKEIIFEIVEEELNKPAWNTNKLNNADFKSAVENGVLKSGREAIISKPTVKSAQDEKRVIKIEVMSNRYYFNNKLNETETIEIEFELYGGDKYPMGIVAVTDEYEYTTTVLTPNVAENFRIVSDYVTKVLRTIR